ncbi:hypothetical protein P9209_04675 [Prescottella defluvii]|nr:hypothetical protein P9209_04675 [Prescottella defluvii]
MLAPAGAAVLAFADEARQRRWLGTVPREAQAETAAVLERIRTTGVGVWGIGAADPGTLDVLADVVELLAADPSQHTLRARVLALLGESVDALTAQGISEVEKLCRSATSSRRCSTPMVARCGNCRSARCVPRSRPRNVHTTSNN